MLGGLVQLTGTAGLCETRRNKEQHTLLAKWIVAVCDTLLEAS